MLFAILARKEQVPHAFMLAETVRQHHPDARVALCLVNYHLPPGLMSKFDEVLLISDHGYPAENPANGGPTKAYFIKYLLNRYLDDIVYMDPETIVYSPFEEVFALLNEHPVIASPFHIEPSPVGHDRLELERLRNGFVHSGLIALKNTERSRRFADWWSTRVNRNTFGSVKSESADHLWLSLAVVPFGIHILKEPGYQVAPWNWHETARIITSANEKEVCLANGKRLCSFVTAGSQEMLHNSDVPVPDQTRSALEGMIRTQQFELELIRQTLP